MTSSAYHSNQLADKIKLLGRNIGFAQIAITEPHVAARDATKFKQWLQNKEFGTMDFMQKNAALRCNPLKFVPWVKSIICCRLDYQLNITNNNANDHIVNYAVCRDYHKVMQSLLKKFLMQIQQLVNTSTKDYNLRLFCDTSPVLEKALATHSGLGWIGKNTLLLNKDVGSSCFLGEIYTDLPLTPDKTKINNLCGNCTKCLDACPTKALAAPYSLNAKRCIAYLTIEHKGSIPKELRPLIGTKIFGCDECQKCCPWNQKANQQFIDTKFIFKPKPQLQNLNLAQLFLWDEKTYQKNTEGTPLRRLGFERWLRNIAIALGNSPKTAENIQALEARLNHPSPLVREHVQSCGWF